jgi:hypothetical protein
MSVHGPRSERVGRVGESRLSTTHDSVIGCHPLVARFPTMRVPRVTEVSSPRLYLRNGVAFGGERHPVVASALRSLSQRSVASASVSKCPVASAFVGKRAVASASVGKRPVAFAYDRVSTRSVASAFQSSPRVALAPAFQSLRQAALAKTCARIARRLVRLAAGGGRQLLQ